MFAFEPAPPEGLTGAQDTETKYGDTEAERETEADPEHEAQAEETEVETEHAAEEVGDTEAEAEETETEAEEPQMVTTDFMGMDTMFGSQSETWIDENLEEVTDPNPPVVETISKIEGVPDAFSSELPGDIEPSPPPVEPKIEDQPNPAAVSLIQRMAAAKNK
jgi:hypothetical protein